MPHLPHSGTNVTPLHSDSLELIAATMDTLLADIALEEPDIDATFHIVIRSIRDRYRDWCIDNHQPLGGGEAG